MEKLKFVALQSIVEPGFWNRMTKERDLTTTQNFVFIFIIKKIVSHRLIYMT